MLKLGNTFKRFSRFEVEQKRDCESCYWWSLNFFANFSIIPGNRILTKSQGKQTEKKGFPRIWFLGINLRAWKTVQCRSLIFPSWFLNSVHFSFINHWNCVSESAIFSQFVSLKRKKNRKKKKKRKLIIGGFTRMFHHLSVIEQTVSDFRCVLYNIYCDHCWFINFFYFSLFFFFFFIMFRSVFFNYARRHVKMMVQAIIW